MIGGQGNSELKYMCPTCKALPGKSCRKKRGHGGKRTPHQPRLKMLDIKNPLHTACTECGAERGVFCRVNSWQNRAPHFSRRLARQGEVIQIGEHLLEKAGVL